MSNDSNKLKNKLRDLLYFKSNLESDEERNRLLNELTTSAETRHQTCLASIYRARGYIDWFVSTSTYRVDSENIHAHRKFFLMKEKNSEEKALISSNAEKELRDFIQKSKGIPKQENTYMVAFLESVRDHLTVKKQIMQREADLGNEFMIVSQNFLRQNLRLLPKSNQETLLAVAKCFKMLKESDVSPAEIKNITADKISNMLDQYNERLQDRYQIINEMQEIIAELESVIKKYAQEGATEESVEPQKGSTETVHGSGMVYKKR